MKYSYIAIEGNIGAGKTTLARKLAKMLGAYIILEQFADNVFLQRFYADPERTVFKLETSFLMDRQRQLKECLDAGEGPFVADYSFGKGMVFAGHNLKDIPGALDMYQDLYSVFIKDLKKPDLIIYLHNTVPNLQKNIHKRGRSFELNIKNEYLEGIEHQYEKYLEGLTDTPVLWLEASLLDFERNNRHFKALLQLLDEPWAPGIHRIQI